MISHRYDCHCYHGDKVMEGIRGGVIIHVIVYLSLKFINRLSPARSLALVISRLRKWLGGR